MSAKLPPEPNRCGLIAFSECETFLSLRVYQLHCRGYVDKKSIVSFNFAVEIPTLPHFLKRSSYQIIDQSDNWSTNLFLSEIRLEGNLIWKVEKKLELLSAMPRAPLMHLSCFPTSRLLHILMNARWRMNQLLILQHFGIRSLQHSYCGRNRS